MKQSIEAQLKNIEGLFSNTNSQDYDGTYVIPVYQRAYSWSDKIECDKLWQDLESFIEKKENDPPKNETYFFGSIIINSDKDEQKIIDGQQRVTTFILLLKALLITINKAIEKIAQDEDSEPIKGRLKNAERAFCFVYMPSIRTVPRR